MSVGSIFIVLDRDLLQCPLDEVPETQVLQTFLGGKSVYRAPRRPE